MDFKNVEIRTVSSRALLYSESVKSYANHHEESETIVVGYWKFDRILEFISSGHVFRDIFIDYGMPHRNGTNIVLYKTGQEYFIDVEKTNEKDYCFEICSPEFDIILAFLMGLFKQRDDGYYEYNG